MPASYKPQRRELSATTWTPDWPYIKSCVFGTIFFYATASIFVYAAKEIPDYNTGSKLFQNIYYRKFVDTQWLPFAQFVSYVCLVTLGWIMENIVTLQKTDPFTSGNGDHRAFQKSLIFAPIFFMVSGIVMFR